MEVGLRFFLYFIYSSVYASPTLPFISEWKDANSGQR